MVLYISKAHVTEENINKVDSIKTDNFTDSTFCSECCKNSCNSTTESNPIENNDSE